MHAILIATGIVVSLFAAIVVDKFLGERVIE